MKAGVFHASQDANSWLDPKVQKDEPIPVFKSLLQLFSENLTALSILFALLVGGFVLWLYLRKRRVALVEESTEPEIDPYEEALGHIRELQDRRPQPQPKPFVFRLSEILRVYVEKLFKVPAMELTGEEFIREIMSHSFFRNRYEDLLREFVNRGDRVKYSEETPDQDEMKLLLDSALHFVKDTHQKLRDEQLAKGSVPQE